LIIGFDLATRLCGWCAGTGAETPIAGAFEIVERQHLGRMGAEFQRHVMAVQRRFNATHWVVEKPLLLPTDTLHKLERLYGPAFLLWTLAEKLGVECAGVDQSTVKSDFTGMKPRQVDKDVMIAMALKLGVTLPAMKVDGRADAADAVGVWKVGVRLFARSHLAKWDAAIYGRRGLV